MLASRLFRLIEENSDQLATDLVDRLRHSSRTVDYFKLTEQELRQQAYGIYKHLGDWLLNKTETEIEYHYTQIGCSRAEQGIAISDFVWALVITKENLWRFLQSHAVADRMFELWGELEFIQLYEQFFDRAMYYAAVGYQRYQKEQRPAKAA